MATHIRLFQTENEFNAARENEYIEPWLSYTEGRGIDYNKSHSYEYVDLGLPSGTLWCVKNIEAENEEDEGGSFKWGAVHPWPEENTPFLDRPDNWMALDPQYDAASVIMGGEWHMPRPAQLEELISGTTHELGQTINGKNVAIFRSKTNGNEIIFPNGTYWGNKVTGYYDGDEMIDCLIINNSRIKIDNDYQTDGLCYIRGVIG